MRPGEKPPVSRDEKVKAAKEEILEVLRKYNLNGYFCIIGRELAEIRWRFSTWSCFEQFEHPKGSEIRFRTRKGGTGDRRSKEDIADSCNTARFFAESIASAGMSAIHTWEQLEKKLGAEGTYDDDLGAPPKWDFE